jgi:regulator of RNase E activity RraB
MKNKLLSLGIPALCLALVLVFGMMVIGCEDLLKALEKDNPETQDYIDSQGKVVFTLTLERSTGDGYDNWGSYYNIPSSVTGGKITAGDVYTFTYSFKSSVAIASPLFVKLVDNSEAAGWWKELANDGYTSSYNGVIPVNTTVSGTLTFTATETATSTIANANRLSIAVEYASNAASAPTLTFTTFSISLVKKGNLQSNIMQGNTVTLTRITGDGYDHWHGYYEIPSSVTGGKVTEGDVYELTYSFKSNVAITKYELWVVIYDYSNWQSLSEYDHNFNNYNDILANTTVSGTITLTATATAFSTSPGTNRLEFGVAAINKDNPYNGAASEPTLTFTTFSLVKTSSGNPQSNITVTLSERSTGEDYDVWQGYYEIPSSVTGSKITAGDTYIFTYAFKSNVDIKESYGLWVGLLDKSEAANGWKGLSPVYQNFNSDMKANTTVSGTFTLNATGTASSASADANKLLFQANVYNTNKPYGATSAPTLTFTTLSLVKQ